MDDRYKAADANHLEWPSVASIPVETIQRAPSPQLKKDELALGTAALAEPEVSDNPDQLPRAEVERDYESVVQLLMQRKARGYRRGIDDDGHKVGLAFDPGSYAGIVGLSMAKKLQTDGLLEYMDSVYGLSAGGVNAAFAATGQIKEGLDTYLNVMPDNKLIDMGDWRKLKPPYMDLNVLKNSITNIHPLKIKELLAGKVPVVIGASDLSRGKAEIIRSTDFNEANASEFIDWLIRGCQIPYLAEGPYEDKEGRKYSEATLTWSSAVELAKQDGCTDILSLANNSKPGPKTFKSIAKKLAAMPFEKIVAMQGDSYIAKYLSPDEYPRDLYYWLEAAFEWEYSDLKIYSTALAKKAAAMQRYSEGITIEDGVMIERVYAPPLEGLPELLTADKNRLKVGIRAGRLAVRQVRRRALDALEAQRYEQAA